MIRISDDRSIVNSMQSASLLVSADEDLDIFIVFSFLVREDGDAISLKECNENKSTILSVWKVMPMTRSHPVPCKKTCINQSMQWPRQTIYIPAILQRRVATNLMRLNQMICI
eukprot:scaffold15892_cov58-Cyclotella_meneghiniana.AAC.2